MLRKLIATVSILLLAFGVTSAVGTAASAHTGDLNAKAVCQDDGTYLVTYKLTITNTELDGVTKWRVGTTSFESTPTSNSGMDRGPVASTGAGVYTLGTIELPGDSTRAPWAYAYTTWSDNYKKGSDGGDIKLDGKCAVTPEVHKVQICHATSSQSHPYANDNHWVSWSAVDNVFNKDWNGHGDHEDDIIPPFADFPGRNWDAAGQAIYNNGCAVPPTTIEPADPTIVNLCGIENDSVTFATTAGITYTKTGNYVYAELTGDNLTWGNSHPGWVPASGGKLKFAYELTNVPCEPTKVVEWHVWEVPGDCDIAVDENGKSAHRVGYDNCDPAWDQEYVGPLDDTFQPEQCTWYQVDKYEAANHAIIAELWADGFLRLLQGTPEDANLVKDWYYVYGGDDEWGCDPPPVNVCEIETGNIISVPADQATNEGYGPINDDACKPAPKSGKDKRSTELCTVPADGTATITYYSKAWTRSYTWDANTSAWVLGDKVYEDEIVKSTSVVVDDTCKPTKPEPLSGSDDWPTTHLCADILNGTAVDSFFVRDWTQSWVWNADTRKWELGDKVFSQPRVTHTTVVDDDNCIPDKPKPLSGTDPDTPTQSCILPANGNATLTSYARDWTQGYSWDRQTRTWVLDAKVFGDKYVTGTQTVESEKCEPPTLDGTVVSSQCVNDVPWINWDIMLNDPNGLSDDDGTATFTFTAAGSAETFVKVVALDTPEDQRRFLWPGADIDSEGNAIGWPGWALIDDEWESIGDENYGWTRNGVTVLIEVNPEMTVNLSYPPPTALCVAGPPTEVHNELDAPPAEAVEAEAQYAG